MSKNLQPKEFVDYVVQYGKDRGDLPQDFKLNNAAQKALEHAIVNGSLHPEVTTDNIHAMCVYYILGYKDAMEYTGVNY